MLENINIQKLDEDDVIIIYFERDWLEKFEKFDVIKKLILDFEKTLPYKNNILIVPTGTKITFVKKGLKDMLDIDWNIE